MATLYLQTPRRTAALYNHLPMLFGLAMEGGQSGIPRYDFERCGPNEYRLTFELPGFSKDDINIVYEPSQLTVRGRSSSLTAKDRLYRGIIAGEFEQVFDLADHVDVTGATLSDGLLVITLKRELPEAYRPRQIPIRTNTINRAGRTGRGVIDQVAHHAMRARQGLERLFQSAWRALRAGGTQDLNHVRHSS